MSHTTGLESSQTPYSKSHAKRLKKKAKEQIANGLTDVGLALPDTADDTDVVALVGEASKGRNDMDVEEPYTIRKRKKTKRGIIGEGKGSTLTDKQRMQVL